MIDKGTGKRERGGRGKQERINEGEEGEIRGTDMREERQDVEWTRKRIRRSEKEKA